MVRSISAILGACAMIVASGCSRTYEPVAASKCEAVVDHSIEILHKLAKPRPELLRDCRKASDQQRGCIMEASIVADLAKCSKLD